MPIVTIGTTAPGEVPLYPNPTFVADPILTPSQVAFFQGTRILSMGVINYDKQQRRFLMSNEMWYLFDKCGGIIDKYMPSDIVKLLHDGEEWPINALEFNNIDLEIEFTDGQVHSFRTDPESRSQWNNALGAFLGVIPSMDCIKNVQLYAEDN